MGKYKKLLFRVLHGNSDSSISFVDLCHLLRQLGFAERVRGSHHMFRKEGITEKLNLQKSNHHAKTYQVRQVRSLILHYKLGSELNDV